MYANENTAAQKTLLASLVAMWKDDIAGTLFRDDYTDEELVEAKKELAQYEAELAACA